MKITLIISCLIVLSCCRTLLLNPNLEKLSESHREEILSAIAKEVVLKYCPQFYRDDVSPLYSSDTINGQLAYTVTYPYGKNTERVYYSYVVAGDTVRRELFSAGVMILAQTGEVLYVIDNNGAVYGHSEKINKFVKIVDP